MKKALEQRNDPEMWMEYDFSRGVRGNYARWYAQGTNVVVLEPDVARIFPNAEAVNRSLQALASIIPQQSKLLASK
jgi:hypothetical protein